MTAAARLADTRRRLATIQRRRGLEGLARWNDLAAWKLDSLAPAERRAA